MRTPNNTREEKNDLETPLARKQGRIGKILGRTGLGPAPTPAEALLTSEHMAKLRRPIDESETPVGEIARAMRSLMAKDKAGPVNGAGEPRIHTDSITGKRTLEEQTSVHDRGAGVALGENPLRSGATLTSISIIRTTEEGPGRDKLELLLQSHKPENTDNPKWDDRISLQLDEAGGPLVGGSSNKHTVHGHNVDGRLLDISPEQLSGITAVITQASHEVSQPTLSAV